jgi:hypothetical protein
MGGGSGHGARDAFGNDGIRAGRLIKRRVASEQCGVSERTPCWGGGAGSVYSRRTRLSCVICRTGA